MTVINTKDGYQWVDEVRMTDNGLPKFGATIEEQIVTFYMKSAWNLITHMQKGDVSSPDGLTKLLRLTFDQVPHETASTAPPPSDEPEEERPKWTGEENARLYGKTYHVPAAMQYGCDLSALERHKQLHVEMEKIHIEMAEIALRLRKVGITISQ